MANHVNSYIEFVKINEPALAKLNEMVSRIRKGMGHEWFSDLFVEGDLTYEESEKYSWTTANLGPKWCYIEDMEIDVDGEVPFINTCSAWSPPVAGLQMLLDILSELDPDMITTMSYDDEMPNFIGWYVFVGNDELDGCEFDEEEIREGIFADNLHLLEQWDYEEECFNEDEDGINAEDEYRDIMYQWISDTQYEGIQDVISNLSSDCGNTDGD
jgi:hypothetical protein